MASSTSRCVAGSAYLSVIVEASLSLVSTFHCIMKQGCDFFFAGTGAGIEGVLVVGNQIAKVKDGNPIL